MQQIFLHTPVWVYGLLVGLIALGYVQTRARHVSKTRAFVLPMIMVAFSLMGVLTAFGFSLTSIALWALGLALVAYIGSRSFAVKGVRFNEVSGHFYLPGSWAPMLVIVTIFITKYIVGVMTALHAPLLNHVGFVIALSFLYGCFSGFFSARALALWQVWHKHKANTTE